VGLGDFRNDVIAGKGKWEYANGDVYVGAFVDGVKHGQGCYHCKASGCQFVGEFEAGTFRRGRWVHKDGSTVHSEFVTAAGVCAPSGPATVSFKRPGLTQEGEHRNGQWLGGAITAA